MLFREGVCATPPQNLRFFASSQPLFGFEGEQYIQFCGRVYKISDIYLSGLSFSLFLGETFGEHF
jgi:hypothetical protein